MATVVFFLILSLGSVGVPKLLLRSKCDDTPKLSVLIQTKQITHHVPPYSTEEKEGKKL